MIQVAIVDDEREVRESLQSYIERFSQEEGLSFQMTSFSDASELMMHYEPRFDIILLDIEMPHLNGMDAAEQIRKVDQKTVLMFITNMAKYAIRGYQVDALDFVMKPVNYYTFRMRFKRGVERALARKEEEMILKTQNSVIKLSIQSIYYVEVQGRALSYHTEQGDYTVKGTIKHAEETLRPYHFEKCNHWYLVNLRHVERMGKDTVTVAGTELEMSRRTRSSFLNALTAYMGGNR